MKHHDVFYSPKNHIESRTKDFCSAGFAFDLLIFPLASPQQNYANLCFLATYSSICYGKKVTAIFYLAIVRYILVIIKSVI